MSDVKAMEIDGEDGEHLLHAAQRAILLACEHGKEVVLRFNGTTVHVKSHYNAEQTAMIWHLRTRLQINGIRDDL